MIAADPYIRAEILNEAKQSLELLTRSVGIKGYNTTSHAHTYSNGDSTHDDVIIDGGLVAALLQTAKGKKLISRTFRLLEPEQRYAAMS